jgi:hypothetical protein
MIPQIDIRQTFGQIDIRTQPARWDIQTRPAEWRIEAPQAELDIHSVPADIEIDQTQAFADEDLRTPLEFLRHEAALAKQAAAEGVAETAQWGLRFLHIERGDAFPEWVMRYRNRQRDIEPALVPRPFSVKVHVRLGGVEVHARVQPVHVEADFPACHIRATAPVVQVSLAQKPSVTIVPPPVGQLVDQRV